MPCSDVTEVLSLTLDHDDRIAHYSLIKMTCGGSVGNPSLLRKWIENKSAYDVLCATGEEILEAIPAASETWEFLTLKHLLSVQNGLKALLGMVPSGLNSACVVDSIESGPNGVRMLAQIKIDIITDEIRSCGGCGTCSTSVPPSDH